MLVGEGPGFYENEQGRPFVGQAGKFLEELLAGIGMKREQVFKALRPLEGVGLELDVIQLAHNYGHLETIMNKSQASDLDSHRPPGRRLLHADPRRMTAFSL